MQTKAQLGELRCRWTSQMPFKLVCYFRSGGLVEVKHLSVRCNNMASFSFWHAVLVARTVGRNGHSGAWMMGLQWLGDRRCPAVLFCLTQVFFLVLRGTDPWFACCFSYKRSEVVVIYCSWWLLIFIIGQLEFFSLVPQSKKHLVSKMYMGEAGNLL